MLMWQRINFLKITNHYLFQVLCNSVGFNLKDLTEKEQTALPLTADREFAQNCLSSLLKLSFPSHLLEHPNPQLLDRSQKERQKKNRNQTIYTEKISKEM